jgi:hypothetical protein
LNARNPQTGVFTRNRGAFIAVWSEPLRFSNRRPRWSLLTMTISSVEYEWGSVMSDEKKSKKTVNRRALVKLTVGSGGALVTLPERWTKPIVQSVVVPAHAQASPFRAAAPTTTASPTTTPAPGSPPATTTAAPPTTTTAAPPTTTTAAPPTTTTAAPPTTTTRNPYPTTTTGKPHDKPWPWPWPHKD